MRILGNYFQLKMAKFLKNDYDMPIQQVGFQGAKSPLRSFKSPPFQAVELGL